MNLFFLVFIGIVVYRSISAYRNYDNRYYTDKCPLPQVEQTDLVFYGKESGISLSQMHDILLKRNDYYNHLEPALQNIFLRRVGLFMNERVFIIKDESGYKEMPVLICGAAVQLCFGLSSYMLPFYKYIRIYPKEYFSEHVFFRVLEGNVQNNVITIAWNHFLKGYEHNADGSNVGLHEMSHALYMQKMVIESDHTKRFCKQYNQLIAECRLAAGQEMNQRTNLYSEYADTNLQEFWAETAELFFERTEELYMHHPTVFDAMCILLNQDPRNKTNPLLKKNFSWNERISRIFKV